MTDITTDTTTTTDTTAEEVADDQLAALPSERLATLLRDKRKSEAGLRTRLRDAESARDGLTSTVQGFQRGALADLATGAGFAETALPDLAAHLPLETLLGDDGMLDRDKAGQALAALKTERPHLFGSQRLTTSGAETFSGGDTARAVTWGDVLSR